MIPRLTLKQFSRDHTRKIHNLNLLKCKEAEKTTPRIKKRQIILYNTFDIRDPRLLTDNNKFLMDSQNGSTKNKNEIIRRKGDYLLNHNNGMFMRTAQNYKNLVDSNKKQFKEAECDLSFDFYEDVTKNNCKMNEKDLSGNKYRKGESFFLNRDDQFDEVDIRKFSFVAEKGKYQTDKLGKLYYLIIFVSLIIGFLFML